MKRNFTDEQAVRAIADKGCQSVSAVLRKLGVNHVSGSSHALIRRIALERGIDTAHWLGNHAWLNRGRPCKPVEDLLIIRDTSSHRLKLQLLKAGYKKHQCENCKRKAWMGQPIPLDLHHKNGNRRDQRPENVELRCPNCHALTPNYCGKARTWRSPIAEASVSKTE